MLAGSATETADILAVMDANEDANVEFLAGESAAALKRNTAATVSLSGKNDGLYQVDLPLNPARHALPFKLAWLCPFTAAFLPGAKYFLIGRKYIWTVISDHCEVLAITSRQQCQNS